MNMQQVSMQVKDLFEQAKVGAGTGVFRHAVCWVGTHLAYRRTTGCATSCIAGRAPPDIVIGFRA